MIQVIETNLSIDKDDTIRDHQSRIVEVEDWDTYCKAFEEYNGEVPKTRKELESLPGVGRKTTNVVLSVGFDEPAFAVDTHVERISKRLGFAKKDDTVNDVERKVCRSIPRDRWNKAHHQFIFFGRYFCKAQNPNCKECYLYDMCKDKIKEVRK